MSSARERIKALREKKRQQDHLDLVVPGYEGELGVRYRPLPEEKVTQFAERIAKKGGVPGLSAAQDLVADAAECILVRDDDGNLVPLRDDEGTVTFAEGLNEYLDIETDSVRETIRETFSPGGTQPMAIVGHAGSVMAWMQGNDSEVDKALLGE